MPHMSMRWSGFAATRGKSTPNATSRPLTDAASLAGDATRHASSNDLSISSAVHSSPTGYAAYTAVFSSAIAAASARVSARH